MHRVHRYHDISAGHRVVGHENKCKTLHGHNYRVHFTCVGDLDNVGRVIDFGVIKSKLCMWLEDHWDHKMLLWAEDPIVNRVEVPSLSDDFWDSIRRVPFNPTAENMAEYLVECVGPGQLRGTGVTLIEVTIEETRKCSATYTLEGY